MADGKDKKWGVKRRAEYDYSQYAWVLTPENYRFEGTKEEAQARLRTLGDPSYCRICKIPEDESDQVATANKQHPGFDITCRRCKQPVAIFESDVGYSDVSGAWGDVRLRCLYCGAEDVIWEPS